MHSEGAARSGGLFRSYRPDAIKTVILGLAPQASKYFTPPALPKGPYFPSRMRARSASNRRGWRDGFTAFPLIWASGGDILSEDGKTVNENQPALRDTLELYRTLWTSGSVPGAPVRIGNVARTIWTAWSR
jgi:ABC-type glycerol-3-phosphate transport system substrate-binding protein